MLLLSIPLGLGIYFSDLSEISGMNERQMALEHTSLLIQYEPKSVSDAKKTNLGQ
jgi:hypothetical protein